MARYRKKPVTIEAFQLGIDYIPDWFMDKVTSNEIILHGTSSGFDHHDDTNADIKTLEGWHHASFGDFIIKGIKGEIYPCKPDIFKMTYESEDTAADVVPKSEVERLSAIIWKLKQENLIPVHSMIKTASLEVAREIFAEIEKYSELGFKKGYYHTQLLCVGCDVFDGLKKKYTEEKSDE